MISLSDKRIGVTGGNGFLGKHVISSLKRNGILEENIIAPVSQEVDLTNPIETDEFVEKCDIIIHLAAKVGGILFNKKYPANLLVDNLKMGINIYESCHKHSIKKLVNIGTTCMYPEHASLPFKEEDIWNGYPVSVTAPYGISKKVLFELSKTYSTQYGLNSINLIPVNLYGPEDHFDGENTHVVPALIKRIFESKTNNLPFLDVWGSGIATREFLYVEDAAEGIVKALSFYDDYVPINLGTGIETSIKNLVTLICDIQGYQGEIRWDTTKPDGTLRRCVDTEKAVDRFRFKADTSLKDGLEKTISWFIENKL